MSMYLNVDPYNTTDTAETGLGTQGFSNGNLYRYAKAGGTELAKHLLTVAPTAVTNHLNMSWQTAPAIGDKKVKVTLGATAATADFYKGGRLVVQDGTGEGENYTVEGNLAADSAGTCIVFLRDPIRVAGALSEANVDLLAHSYSGTVIAVTDQLDEPTGWPQVTVAIGYYYWSQTGGYCNALADETLAIGAELTIGTSVAGAVEAADAAGEPIVGQQVGTGGVDTEYQLIKATIDKAVNG